jgi:hypothetical protein
MTDTRIERFGPVAGEAHGIRVMLTGLPFRSTDKGPRWAYGEFGPEFLEGLHEALTAPRRRGLFRSMLECPWCEHSLAGLPSETVSAAVDVDLRRIPPIQVDVEMPGYVCPGCARRPVRIDDRDVQSDLSDALIDAFEHAGLRP